MADATTSLLLKQISAAHDQVGSAIQRLEGFGGSPGELTTLDLEARTAWLGYTAELEAAERQLALGHVEPGPFLDAFKEKLSTLRGQSAGLNAELRRARRAAKSNVKAAARAELLSGDDRAAANGKVDDALKVTSSLRSTRAQLSTEVDAGVQALRLLAQDKTKIGNVKGSMDGMQEHLGEGHSLLDTFKGKDFIDNLWIGAAFLIYCATVCWILYRRLGLHRIVGLLSPFVELIYANFVVDVLGNGTSTVLDSAPPMSSDGLTEASAHASEL